MRYTRQGILDAYAAGQRDFAWADLAGADLAGADLAWANLAWANLDGANLAGAAITLPGYATGYLLKYGWWLEPSSDGPLLSYGCERHKGLDWWETNLPALCQKHVPNEAAKYEAALRSLLALCRAVR